MTKADDLRERSGEKFSADPLVDLFYTMLRDGDVSPGRLEELVNDHVLLSERGIHSSYYTNGYLAQYAGDIADRLKEEAEVRTALFEAELELEVEAVAESLGVRPDETQRPEGSMSPGEASAYCKSHAWHKARSPGAIVESHPKGSGWRFHASYGWQCWLETSQTWGFSGMEQNFPDGEKPALLWRVAPQPAGSDDTESRRFLRALEDLKINVECDSLDPAAKHLYLEALDYAIHCLAGRVV